DWDRRLVLVSPTAPWPYAAGYFDFILTNQVMEHVRDHRFVFGELRRCLSPAGTSVHLFPVREVAWEGHAHMPVVHWFREPRRARAMRLFAALGFDRRYREDRARRNWASHGEFARAYSSVLEKNTNYISVRELRRLAGEAGLTLSFRFTKDYFIAKLLSYAGIRPRRYCDLGGFETLLMLLLRHIASVTVVLAKTGTDLSLSP
ncbi:MAG: methyltransferase domain-containing protein, partial [Gammaproteobacteria bacterium]|nr:methyltransferase domain-containing protein [Gammaproteobacteria bacterium]